MYNVPATPDAEVVKLTCDSPSNRMTSSTMSTILPDELDIWNKTSDSFWPVRLQNDAADCGGGVELI